MAAQRLANQREVPAPQRTPLVVREVADGERLQAASELGGDAVDSWDATYYHDLSVNWESDTWGITVALNNVTDEGPAVVDQNASGATLGNGSQVLGSGYDLIGRRLYMNVRKAW